MGSWLWSGPSLAVICHVGLNNTYKELPVCKGEREANT